jgi:hypothetical protein
VTSARNVTGCRNPDSASRATVLPYLHDVQHQLGAREPEEVGLMVRLVDAQLRKTILCLLLRSQHVRRRELVLLVDRDDVRVHDHPEHPLRLHEHCEAGHHNAAAQERVESAPATAHDHGTGR